MGVQIRWKENFTKKIFWRGRFCENLVKTTKVTGIKSDVRKDQVQNSSVTNLKTKK